MENAPLQIAACDQKKPARGWATVGKQRRPRTKVTQYKGLDMNVAKNKKTETSGRRRKQKNNDTKAIDLSTTL